MDVDKTNTPEKTLTYKIMKLLVILSCIPIFGVILSPLPVSYSIFSKSKRMAKISVACLSVNLFIIWFIYSVLTVTDPFTDDLYIPSDIEINEPLELKYNDNRHGINWKLINANSPERTKFDLVYWGGEPGIYEFALWYKSDRDGYLYIKAFEITKGTPLSVSRLKDRSKLDIGKSNELRFYHNQFTIYEGDWGYPYAARFEVWFSASDGDVKISEKNYIIEGWMR